LDTPLFDTESLSAFIGYGFAVNGTRIYISEAAQDFSSDGKVFVYTTSGELLDEIPVGLGPNGFYFN
jgi:DNA-binding beta-propeller fold protein YncE